MGALALFARAIVAYSWSRGGSEVGEEWLARAIGSGLLIRHDYRAEIIGHAACGAHRSLDDVEVRGLPLAQRREVSAKIGHSWRAPYTPMPVLHADLESWCVELADRSENRRR